MARQKIVIEEGYRTDDVEGATITSMGIVESEKGGYRAFIDFDDSKGMATYNMTAKGEIVGSSDETGNYRIPGYLDFSKVNKSLQALGYEPYIDLDAKEWGTEPAIVEQPIWIKCVKTSTDKDGKEYKSLIDVVKVGSEEVKPPAPLATKPAPKGATKPAPKGVLTPELEADWDKLISQVLTQPLNDIGINAAIKKIMPDDPKNPGIAVHRKALADVRAKYLAKKVSDGVLEMDENAKYSIAG